MSHDIWLRRWEEKNIGWHEEDGNPFLKSNYELLELKEGDTVFIPLCGKSLDIHFFLAKGQKVVGCELSHVAITELFDELGVEPFISTIDEFKVYSSESLTVFEGDILHLSAELVGHIDAIYDRASMVALPYMIRGEYTKLLRDISKNAKQLLVSFDYDQEIHQRTPYSVPLQEIESHYKEFYTIKKLDSVDVEGGLKGSCPAKEEVYLLS